MPPALAQQMPQPPSHVTDVDCTQKGGHSDGGKSLSRYEQT
jgi:hypothetical protein